MKKFEKIGEGYFDPAEIAALMPRDAERLLVFLKSGQTVSVKGRMSAELLRLIGR